MNARLQCRGGPRRDTVSAPPLPRAGWDGRGVRGGRALHRSSIRAQGLTCRLRRYAAIHRSDEAGGRRLSAAFSIRTWSKSSILDGSRRTPLHRDGAARRADARQRGAGPAQASPLEAVEVGSSGARCARRGARARHRPPRPQPENLFLNEVAWLRARPRRCSISASRACSGRFTRAPQPLAVRTQTGALVGSPRLMSPERVAG